MNNPPPLLQWIIGALLALAPLAALSSFVLAGIRLRAEGGVNYEAGGGFFKWIFWGVVFLTLPGISLWMSQNGGQGLMSSGMYIITPGTAGSASAYISQLQTLLSAFVNDILISRLVPVLAAAMVFKAILDSAEGNSPLPSIIAALFLLSVKGFWTLVTSSVVTNDQYATTDLLQQMFGYLSTVISPLIGAICLCGAILCYVRNQGWSHLVFAGIAFLSVPGLWALVKAMAGVSLTW